MAVDEDIGFDRHRFAARALDRKLPAVDFRRDAFDNDSMRALQAVCSINVACAFSSTASDRSIVSS